MEIKIIQMNGNFHALVRIDYNNLSLKVINRNDKVKEVKFHTLTGLEMAVEVANIYKSLFHHNYHKHEICKMLGISYISNLSKILHEVKPKVAKGLIRKYLGNESKTILREIL